MQGGGGAGRREGCRDRLLSVVACLIRVVVLNIVIWRSQRDDRNEAEKCVPELPHLLLQS
jgi:hypothetical protein